MLKILIAEDEPLEQHTLKCILEENYSYTADIRTADNGVDAVSMAEIWNADLVVMDIGLPGLSGINAALEIVRHNPQVKLIFVTAYSSFEYAVEAVRLRAVDYLLKPVEDEKLITVVGRAIGELKQQAIFYEQIQEVKKPQVESTLQNRNELLMKKVAEYVEKNYQYDISQEIICDILNMSTGYFSKLFHQYYGVRFIDYITNVRVEAAKGMLADSTKYSSEIGMRVGYQSSSYFSKIFKQKTGLTPLEYRARLK